MHDFDGKVIIGGLLPGVRGLWGHLKHSVTILVLDILQVHQPLQHFTLPAWSLTFRAVENKHDDDQSCSVFSIFVFSKTVHCCH